MKVDVRIISATNRDLIADVKAGRFREDLFYRLHVFPISVPPLRQRQRGHPRARPPFPRPHRGRGRQARARASSPRRWPCSRPIRWPGNVRQLENAIFRAVVLADGERIGVHEFPQIAAQVGPDAIAAQPMIDPSPAIAAAWPDAREAADSSGPLAAALTTPSLRLTDAQGEVRPLEDIEREVIRFAIAHYREQMSEVARRLKIGRSTLYRKLEGLGLDDGPQATAEQENATA